MFYWAWQTSAWSLIGLEGFIAFFSWERIEAPHATKTSRILSHLDVGIETSNRESMIFQ
jgi:hypothetical protein